MTDLDDALRTTLRERAHDIDGVPSHLLRPDDHAGVDGLGEVIDLTPRRWHTPRLIAASVAAVLVLAGALVGLQHVNDHDTPAARSGSPGPTQPTTSSPVVAKGAECQTSLPAAWHTAFTAPTAAGASKTSLVLGLSPAGAALISRDFGSRRDVVLVRPGAAPRVVFNSPYDHELQPYSGGLSGQNAVVPLYRTSGSGTPSTLTRLLVIGVDHPSVTQIAETSDADLKTGHNVIDGSVVLDGSVYWDVRTDATHGVVMRYDLRTEKTTTVYRGPIGSGSAPVRVSAAGVIVADPGGGFTLRVPATLPAAVSSRLDAQSALTLGTDGTAYAWFDQSKQTISWWSPGQGLRTRHTALGQPDGDDSIPQVSVAGPYVLYVGPGSQVLDTRSGAVAALPNTVVSAGGGYVGTYLTMHHSGERAGVVDTSVLPALHC